MENNSLVQKERNSAVKNAEFTHTEKTKTCVLCKIEKPLNSDYFHRKAKSGDGFAYRCKKCVNKNTRIQNVRVIIGVIFCSRCLTYLPASVEFFAKSTIYGNRNVHTCTKCRAEDFNIRYLSDEKLKSDAKIRHKKWRDENREHVREKTREWKRNNKQRVIDDYLKYSKTESAKQKRREAQKARTLKNPIPARIYSSARNRRVKNSIPNWESKKAIIDYYKNAKNLGMEVDHIVPIKSDIVCGLHCIDNFQLMTREDNARKGNRFWPDMP